jgi:PAS domain S-box-containing protein
MGEFLLVGAGVERFATTAGRDAVASWFRSEFAWRNHIADATEPSRMMFGEVAAQALIDAGPAVLFLLLPAIALRWHQNAAAPRNGLDITLFTLWAASLFAALLGASAMGMVTNAVYHGTLIAMVAAAVSSLDYFLGRDAGRPQVGPRFPDVALQVEIGRLREVEARISQLEDGMEAQIGARTAALAAVTAALEKEIIERKLAELRFIESRRWIDELMLRTNTAMVLIDREMRVLESNDALPRLLGRRSLGEMLHCNFDRLLAPDNRGRIRHFCDETLRLGTFTCQVEAVAPGGETIAIEANGVASVGNGLPCIMALLHDVSSRSAVQRELIRRCDALSAAVEVAGLANASRPAFLAKLNHELRTSLSGIIGLNEMLRHTASARTLPGSDIRKLSTGIHRSGSRLLSMVNDLLDLSRLEADTWSLHPARMAVREEIDLALTMLDPVPEERQITVENTCSADLEFVADTQAFRLIVLKLASNAVKVSPPGGRIGIGATHRDGALALHVTDQGPGIEESDRERILKQFERAFYAEEDRLDGVGLGLSIVRKVLEMQSGRLEIESRTGDGATFTAILPLAVGQLKGIQLAAE